MHQIGNRIRTVRGKMSRKEFFERFGVKPKTLQRYEEGTSNPSQRFIEQLSDNFGVSLLWLQTGEGRMYEDKNVQIIQKLDTETEVPMNTAAPSRDTTAALIDAMQSLLVLTKENGDLRVEVEKLRSRVARLENDLEEALKSAPGEDTKRLSQARTA